MNHSPEHSAARQLADELHRTRSHIVFAESCTAGLIAAGLARIPGISTYLCGSAVVYRDATKTAWLGVSARVLMDESIGPVSEEVAGAMAAGVLERTEEADLAASVTGHLGPDAPEDLDGILYVALATRNRADRTVQVERVLRHDLKGEEDSSIDGLARRHDRQCRAAEFVLLAAAELLRRFDGS